MKTRYMLYYMDNDRQKIVVASGLNYEIAYKMAGNLSVAYGTDVEYEVVK